MPKHDLARLLRKLEANGPFDEDDRRAILALPYTRRRAPASTYLIREGDPARTCSILISGFAFRHKIVGNGGRQIVSVHLPGDALDFQGIYLDCADHNAQTLTQAELAVVPMQAIRDLVESRPRVARSVLRHMLVEASILREWITNIGRRDARTRIAHFLCEFVYRLDAQGIGNGSGGYELPMTQEQIGDALGLTSVHVNRSIKILESEGLVGRHGRLLSIPDIGRLREAGEFGELYLHADCPPMPG